MAADLAPLTSGEAAVSLAVPQSCLEMWANCPICAVCPVSLPSEGNL